MSISRRDAIRTALVTAAATRLPAAVSHQDRILADAEHQVIENFGASDCWSMQMAGGWSDPNRNRVADLLFSRDNGIGLSCWRFNIGGGINPQITDRWRTAETFEIDEGKYDWTRQANERWFLAAAKRRDVPQFLAFVNSPPGRMTRNGLTFCDPEGYTCNLKPGFEGQFARYLADILDHFRNNSDEAERIAFDYVSPVNEPQWDWSGHSQEGTRASNADIKAILKALAAELKRRGNPTQIAALESGSLQHMWQFDPKAAARWGAPYGNYLADFLGDPEIAPLLGGRIGYHDYGSDRLQGEMVENRKRLAQETAAYPDWKTWMTEYCILTGADGKGGDGRDLTMKTALEVARLIHLDLTICKVSAWQWWTSLSPVDFKDGLIYTDWKKPGDVESIYPARLLWALGNYSRFVRPGMRRVELDGPAHTVTGLMGSAYKDDLARQLTAVYLNFGAAPQTVHLNVSGGWKPKKITPYLTSPKDGDELKAYPAFDPGRMIRIPAQSVMTLCIECE